MEEKIDYQTDLAKNITRLKEKVLVTTPILKQSREQQGSKTLYAHALGYKQIVALAVFADRRQEFIGAIAQQVSSLLGERVARSVAAQLERHYFVSTSDHHGPICHPFSLSANLIAAAPQIDSAEQNLENIIVLSCANVSLNNSSFPRGLIFHSDLGDPNELQQLSFFPAKERACPVYGLQAYTQKDVNHVKRLLSDKVWNKQVGKEKADKIVEIIDAVYSQPAVLQSQYYSEQITKTNFQLWQQFFSSAKQAPNLVYIDQETVVSKLLTKYHLGPDTIISDLILDSAYQQLAVKYFDNIIGAFSVKHQTGTYLFWALPKGKKYRERLWVQGSELVSDDGTFRVSLKAEAIRTALESGELIPSTLLSFLVMSFYYGVTCLGGFSQPSYLTAMKHAYILLLREVGNNAEANKCEQVETAIMGGDMALALLQDKQGGLHQATGLDLMLYGKGNLADTIARIAKTMTFTEATDIMMPLFYEVMYTEHEREKNLQHITVSQIAALNGLDKKIQPCVFM